MTPPHVLDQLPLWVEGDLTAPELEAVERHLAACPACREAADQLRQSQAWLREALASPFGAEDRARLRVSVMARLAAPPPAPRRFLVPSALLAAAAVLVVAVLTWNRPQGKPAPLPTAGTGPEFTRHGTAGATDIPAPAPPHPPRVHLARVAHAQAQLQARQRPDATALPRRELTRLEFQTADPTIRIIWLAQAMPLPGPNPTLEETP